MDKYLKEKVLIIIVSQKEFVKNLFENNKKEVDEIQEIVRIIRLIKSEKEESIIYTTTFYSS